jgi:hypothetical protein
MPFVKDANFGPALSKESQVLLPEGKIVRRNDHVARPLLDIMKNALLMREPLRL